MDNLLSIGLPLLAGLVLGSGVALCYFRARMAEARTALEIDRAGLLEQVKVIPELKEQVRLLGTLQARIVELETLLQAERNASADKLQVLDTARTNLVDRKSVVQG